MLTLEQANGIIDAALAHGDVEGLNPLTVVVLDPRGAVKGVQSQDGSSLMRFQIAHGKAYGAVALGIGSRAIFERAQQQPYFVDSVGRAANGALVPVPGGVLVKDDQGVLLGAVGVTGDTSDNDEAAAIAGIKSKGLTPVTG